MALPKFRIRQDPRNNPRTGGKSWLFVHSVNGQRITGWRLARSGDVVELPEGSGGGALLAPLNPEAVAIDEAWRTRDGHVPDVTNPADSTVSAKWPQGLGRW
jgi:hypothetical protein